MITTDLEIALMQKLNDAHNENHRLSIRCSQFEDLARRLNELCQAILESQGTKDKPDLVTHYRDISVTDLYKKSNEALKDINNY